MYVLFCFHSSLVQTFNNHMDNTLDDLQENFVCHTIADVQKMQEEFEGWKAAGLQDDNKTYDELNGLTTQMAELGSTENPYTTLTPEVTQPKYLKHISRKSTHLQ